MYHIEESDVVQLLKALDNKKRKKLTDHILPYLQNVNKKQSRTNHQIFAYSISFAPKFNQKKFSKTNLLRAIPSIASETEIQFNKRMSVIKQAILQFIVEEVLQKNENEIATLIYLLDFLVMKF